MEFCIDTCIYIFNFICMRTTLILNDELVEKARELTGIKEKTALIHEGLRTLIELQSMKKLAGMEGVQKNLKIPGRRRFK